MSRGIAIPEEPLLLHRMIEAFYKEREREYKLAQLTALAGINASADAIVRTLNELRDLFFPNNETEEDILARNKEKLETLAQEEVKTYAVQSLDLSSHD